MATAPRRNPAVSFTRVDADLVVYHAGTDTYLVLNETAGAVFEAMDGVLTVDDLTRLLVDRFDVDQARARLDVEELLTTLGSRGLVAP